MTRCALPLALACLGACGPTSGAAAALADAAHGNPGALDRCAAIVDAPTRGLCVVTAAPAASLPALEAACDGLADPSITRDECWFLLSERSVADIDAAVDACARSGRFQIDCARHLYEAVTPARQEAALAALRERMPDHAASFAKGSAWLRAEDANVTRAAAIAQDMAEDAELARQVEIARSTQPQTLDLARRWRRRARREPEVRAVLCAGTLDEVRAAASRWPDLVWTPTEVDDLAVQDARTRACQAAAP